LFFLFACCQDNTGYDLKQLFIGGEGTLGVVSKVSILAARKPKCQLVAMLGCASYDHVLRAMQQARSELLEIVSAIEFLDRESLELVVKHIPSQSGSDGCAICGNASNDAVRIAMDTQAHTHPLTRVRLCLCLSLSPSPCAPRHARSSVGAAPILHADRDVRRG